jgi:hypothetical protein
VIRLVTSAPVVAEAMSEELRVVSVELVAPVVLVEPLVAPIVELLLWSALRVVSLEEATEPVPLVEALPLRPVVLEEDGDVLLLEDGELLLLEL